MPKDSGFSSHIEVVVLQPNEKGYCYPVLPTPGTVLAAYVDQVTTLLSPRPVAAICLAVISTGEQKGGVRDRVFRVVNAGQPVDDLPLCGSKRDKGCAEWYSTAPYLRFVCVLQRANAYLFEKITPQAPPGSAGLKGFVGGDGRKL